MYTSKKSLPWRLLSRNATECRLLSGMFLVANDFIFRHNSLPSDLNDSEDMLLLDILVVALEGTLTSMEDLDQSSESNSSNVSAVKDDEVSSKSKSNSYRGGAAKEATFPMSKMESKVPSSEKETVVLKDLGDDYLEHLLSSPESGNIYR
ncbi:hypothetical protein L2E82_13041 [Cichorium intybus]|uniref:Uncharacterized protein n=1 Tax=Cichorium intybus TaxID=13427 RepID=A0ACB9GIR5_CICIN|nr:hypothetical protein L2E82_13041 [Cichorium intybus]